jgi:hypothetical protein
LSLALRASIDVREEALCEIDLAEHARDPRGVGEILRAEEGAFARRRVPLFEVARRGATHAVS